MADKKLYFLAVDFGTESVRGALFNDVGKIIYTAARTYKTYFAEPGWAGQKPSEWWGSFLYVVRNIVDNSGISAESIVSMAIDTTSCTVLALDKSFRIFKKCNYLDGCEGFPAGG